VPAATFARELELDSLDAQAGEVVAEYLDARWRIRERELHRAPRLPAMFTDRSLRRRLDGWRAESRRAEMLWRWCVLAAIEGDAAVREAVADAHGAAVVAARNRAARELGWRSYWSLGLAVAELDDEVWAQPSRAPQPWPAPPLEAELESGMSPAGSVECILHGFEQWGLATAGVTLDVTLSANPDEPVRARTFPVMPPADVRVFVRGPNGPRGWRALAHELGHAVYARHHAPGGPWSLRAAPSRTMHEAVAHFAESVVAAPGVAAAQVRRAAAERRVYAGDDVPVRSWMITDPVAQPAYARALGIADAMWRASAALEPRERGPWLIERVLAPGAALSTAQLSHRFSAASGGAC